MSAPDVIRKVMIAEALGDGRPGLELVAASILNRSVKRNLSPEDVVKQPSQYTAYKNPGSVVAKSFNDPKAIALVDSIWDDMVANGVPQKYAGVDYYHTDAVNPSWNKSYTEKGKVGSHIYYASKGDGYRVAGTGAPTPATMSAGLRDGGSALDAIAAMAGGTAGSAYAPGGMSLSSLPAVAAGADVPLPRRRPTTADQVISGTFRDLGASKGAADSLALNPVTGGVPTGFDAGLGFFSNGQPAMGMLPERANSLGMTAGIDPTFTLPQYPDPASMSDDMRLMRSANAQGLPPLPPLTGERPANIATGYDDWLAGGALPGAGPSTRTVTSIPIDPNTRLPMNTETQQAADTSRWGSQFMRNDRLPTGTPGATAMDPVSGGIPPQVVASSGFKHAGEGVDPLVGLPPFPQPYGVAEGARNRYASNNLYGTGGVDIDPGMIPPVPQRFGMGDLARIAAPNREAVADRVDGMRAGMVPTNLPGRASTSQSNGLMGTLASLFGGGPKTGVATMQDIQRPNPSQQYGLAGAGLFRTPAFGNALASALSAATPGGANLSNFAIGTNGYAYERNKDGSYDRAGRPSSNGSSYGSLINRLTA